MKFLLLLPQQAGLVATATIAGLIMSLNNSAIAQAPPQPIEGTPRPPYGAPVPPPYGGRPPRPPYGGSRLYPPPPPAGNSIPPYGSVPVPLSRPAA